MIICLARGPCNLDHFCYTEEMDILSILLIALGLAMDAFAVAVSSGFIIKNLKLNNALKIAAFFGTFQLIMPIIGWFAGMTVSRFISGFDHWVAFGLLLIVGLHMIYESLKCGSAGSKINPLNIFVLFTLAIATSIDALAVGLSLSFLKVAIIMPSIIIGIVTFCLSFLGVYIGNKVGHFFERRIEFVGGLILIGIGIRILLEHVS